MPDASRDLVRVDVGVAQELGLEQQAVRDDGQKSRSTSSGSAWSRPWMSAHPRVACSSARLPRTDAPSETKSMARVARISATIHR